VIRRRLQAGLVLTQPPRWKPQIRNGQVDMILLMSVNQAGGIQHPINYVNPRFDRGQRSDIRLEVDGGVMA
jgi:pentose-5-phosphate-3-epimerase